VALSGELPERGKVFADLGVINRQLPRLAYAFGVPKARPPVTLHSSSPRRVADCVG
jgi:hypothetical protein